MRRGVSAKDPRFVRVLIAIKKLTAHSHGPAGITRVCGVANLRHGVCKSLVEALELQGLVRSHIWNIGQSRRWQVSLTELGHEAVRLIEELCLILNVPVELMVLPLVG